jgi:hypothetical protein
LKLPNHDASTQPLGQPAAQRQDQPKPASLLKTVWSTVNTLLSVIGLATVVYVGVRLQQGTLFSNLRAPVDAVVNPLPTPIPSDPGAMARAIQVKLNSSRYLDDLSLIGGPSTPPRQGKTYLLCNVTVTYSGGGQVRITDAGWGVVSQDKQLYRSSAFWSSPRDLQPLGATLLDGGTTTGDLLFEVDKGAIPIEIRYASAYPGY